MAIALGIFRYRSATASVIFAFLMVALFLSRPETVKIATSRWTIDRSKVAHPVNVKSPSCKTEVASIKPVFAATGTDKLPRHGYHRYYDQFLQALYSKPVRMVEIGVRSGESLGAWQAIFDRDRSTIYGISWPKNEEVKTKLDANAHVLYLDQSNCTHLDELARTVGAAPVDIVVDDGSHHPEHQLKTLAKLFPVVAPGGYYFIEDVETSYWDMNGASVYDYGLAGVGTGRPGSLITALLLLTQVVNQRYAVTNYDPSFYIIDSGVDPDVAWIAFAQNMVIIRKKSNEDKTYGGPVDNQADGVSWKDFWESQAVQAAVNVIRQWKC